jgi:hypothetical protein
MADADKGKGLLALMVGSPKKSAPEAEGSSSSSEKADAAKEFFEAGKAGEWEEAALIFERMHELCAGDYDDEEEEEEIEEE